MEMVRSDFFDCVVVFRDYFCNYLDGELYWAREKIPSNAIKYENQRPFLEPAPIMEGHSVAVEATSYALLTYVAREGVGMFHERIVQWLTSVRVTFIGYFSTVVSFQS